MTFGPVEKDLLALIDFSLPEDGNQTRLTLPGVEAKEFEAFVIAPKWGRKEWRGLLYPENAKESDYLNYYANHFPAIELNATFYSAPKKNMLLQWKEKVSQNSDFLFIPKVPRIISHLKRLQDVEMDIAEYFDTIKVLGKKLGPSFIQLSDTFGTYKYNEIETFLRFVPNEANLFFEVRHETWFSKKEMRKQLFSLMNDLNIGSIITDSAGRRDCLHMELTRPEAYIRFIGYGKEFLELDKGRIDSWADRISQWKSKGLEKVYFVIHLDGDEDAFVYLADYAMKEFNKKLGTMIPELKIT